MKGERTSRDAQSGWYRRKGIPNKRIAGVQGGIEGQMPSRRIVEQEDKRIEIKNENEQK